MSSHKGKSMAYPVEQIINVVENISSGGLRNANFGVGMIFAEDGESTDTTFAGNTFRDYTSIAGVAADFPVTSETYYAALAWFTPTPRPSSLRIYQMADGQTETQAVAAAINNGVWWYWTCFNRPFYSVDADVLAVAALLSANGKYFCNCQDAADIRDPASTTDIASLLTAQGTRRAHTLARPTGDTTYNFYGAFADAAYMSRVNFSAANSTITLEGKILGIVGEDSRPTAYTAMKAKKAGFYTRVELQGQFDSGRRINSITHSAFNEYIDDVFNLDGFTNQLTVALYNAIYGDATKVPQTPAGEATAISAAANVGETFITNGYLGERQYVDPRDGKRKVSRGYEVLTVPEDIFKLSDADRADRQLYPIEMLVFPAGAAHGVSVTVNVEK